MPDIFFTSHALIRCTYCDEPLKEKYDHDHFIPRSKGGKHEGNKFPVCSTCNFEKGALVFESINQVRVFVRYRKLHPYIVRKTLYMRLVGNKDGLGREMKLDAKHSFGYQGRMPNL